MWIICLFAKSCRIISPETMPMVYFALTIYTYWIIKEGGMGCIHARTFPS